MKQGQTNRCGFLEFDCRVDFFWSDQQGPGTDVGQHVRS
jgi:hypothetical protein